MTTTRIGLAQKHWDALVLTDDGEMFDAAEAVEADLKAGKIGPSEVLEWVDDAVEAGWMRDFHLFSLETEAVLERDLTPILQRTRGKQAAHVRLKSDKSVVKNIVIHPSSRRDGKLQISEFDPDMIPYGHRMRSMGIEDALRDVWRDDGPFDLVMAGSTDHDPS